MACPHDSRPLLRNPDALNRVVVHPRAVLASNDHGGTLYDASHAAEALALCASRPDAVSLVDLRAPPHFTDESAPASFSLYLASAGGLVTLYPRLETDTKLTACTAIKLPSPQHQYFWLEKLKDRYALYVQPPSNSPLPSTLNLHMCLTPVDLE